MSRDLINVIRNFLSPTRIIGISALKGYNLDDVYAIIHDVFCGCGDLM